VCLAFAALAFASAALAQPYPSHPITLIVPFGAGGPVDTLARTLSEAMRTSLGQPVVIENVTGASGTIGVIRAARAAPDGYTVSIGNWPSHVVNGAIYTLPFDLLKDFEPVARLPSNPYVVVARKDLPAGDLKELIAWLKANPDKATQGTAGPGSGQHVSGVYFQNVTGTRFQFVPYRAGSSEIMRDLVAGHIDLTFDQAITALPHVRGGRVKAYAVTSNSRLSAAPDIPTVDEAGAPGVYISTWYGM
jgi:tripartite-type tricarboxylate transporter receptor subunit TctC